MNQNFLNWKIEEKSEDLFSKDQGSQKKEWIICGTLAFFATIFQFFSIESCSKKSSESYSYEQEIVVASKKISSGEELNNTNTKTMKIASSEKIKDYILSPSLTRTFGYHTMTPLNENSPILRTVLKSNFETNTIPIKIPPGKRLYILDIDLGEMANILKPQDKVDLIAQMDIPHFGKATEIILDCETVVGMGSSLSSEDNTSNANSISFYLTPEQVKILSFMKPYANFSLVLRNPNDVSSSLSKAMTFNKFLENEKIQSIINNDSFKVLDGKQKL